MNHRKIVQIVPAVEVTEGAGVSVFRSIGTPARRNLDPFLMLDQFSTYNPDDYVAGFPDHPHRGFNTFTYMIDGHMRHGDSMGNQGDLGPGGAQWMKAGSGVIHSEMPQQESGRMRGFQLWINLPAELKMTAPEYQEITPQAIPEQTVDDATVRIIAGEFNGHKGPVSDPNTQFQFIDVGLAAGKNFVHFLPENHTAFVYLFEGEVMIGNDALNAQQLAVLDKGRRVTITADSEGARFLIVAGRAIGEPIVQYGPFVMNTREQIEQALDDYRDGKLVQTKAHMISR
ncbi:MAG: pirin family protein [Thiotrichales bacterium]|nr:MAG: pirin family protein [Thiotrichales bacterium]